MQIHLNAEVSLLLSNIQKTKSLPRLVFNTRHFFFPQTGAKYVWEEATKISKFLESLHQPVRRHYASGVIVSVSSCIRWRNSEVVTCVDSGLMGTVLEHRLSFSCSETIPSENDKIAGMP